MPAAVAVLVRTVESVAGAPEDRPVGRAALALREEGVEVVFGDEAGSGAVSGFVARPGQWDRAADVGVAAVHDRFPARLDPERYRSLCASLGSIPMGNPTAMMWLCQDKVATASFAGETGVVMPEIETDPGKFITRLEQWRTAYLKPRYGTAGRGVERVVAGTRLPDSQDYPQAGADGPRFLQRAVEPPDGWTGVAVRVAAQRRVDGSWLLNPAVARRSRTDWVVNADRGAQVVEASDVLDHATVVDVRRICRSICSALERRVDGDLVVEVGIDLVIDRDARPWLVELNARPRGRLAALASVDPGQFAAAHVAACARPLRRLLAIAGR